MICSTDWFDNGVIRLPVVKWAGSRVVGVYFPSMYDVYELAYEWYAITNIEATPLASRNAIRFGNIVVQRGDYANLYGIGE